MREAPALAGATRPRPRSAAASKGKAPLRKNAAPATLLGRAFARPGVTIAGAAFAALMTGIVANAIFFQKGHHPAPLLNPSPATPPQPPTRAEIAAPPAAPVAAPTAPPPAPAATAPAPAQAGLVASPAASVPKAAAPHPHKTATKTRKDAIGDLLGTLAPGSHKPAAAKHPASAGPAPQGDAKPRPHLVKDAAPPQD